MMKDLLNLLAGTFAVLTVMSTIGIFLSAGIDTNMSIYMLIAFVVSAFFATVFLYISDYIEKLERKADINRWSRIR